MMKLHHVVILCASAMALLAPNAAAQPLPNTGQISGYLHNADGTPYTSARVEARRLAPDGSRRLEPIGAARVDGQGRFQISGLPPGDYYVAAVPLDEAVPIGSEPAATYYPGVLDDLEAQSVRVDPQGHVSDLDLRMRRDAGVRMSGVIVSHNNKALRTGQVSLSRMNDAGLPIGPTSRGRFYPNGAFFFLNIVPGQYLVRASGQTFGERRSLIAESNVPVGAVPLENLRLVLQPGSAPAAGNARHQPDAMADNRGTEPQADKHAQASGVHSGSNGSRSMPPVTASAAVPVAALAASRSTQPMERTALTGVVRRANGAPATSRSIVVFPSDASNRDSSRVGFARTDAAGRYLVAGLPPGDYLVAVTPDADAAAATDARALQQLRDRAVLVSLIPGTAHERNLSEPGPTDVPVVNDADPPRPKLDRIPPPVPEMTPAKPKPPVGLDR